MTLASISICNIFSAEMATFAKESNCGSFLRKSKLVMTITPFLFIFYLTSNETPLPLPQGNPKMPVADGSDPYLLLHHINHALPS